MKPILLFALTLIILTYSQRTGGGRGSKTTTTTPEAPIRHNTIETTETYEPTEAPIRHNAIETTPQPTEDTSTHTYSVEPTSRPTTPAPTWPVNAEVASCGLVSYTTKTCSCGTMCSSYEREYFGECWELCGDLLLRTGEFGKEVCDLNDFFAKDMSKNYTMMVLLPCEDSGEFAFMDKGFRMDIGLISLIVMGVYLFVY